MSKVIKLIFFFLMAAFILFLAVPAFASGDDIEQKAVLTGGDNISENSSVIRGGRSYGLSAGDVDINDSYRSFTYLFGLVTETKLNPWKAAAYLDSWGSHTEAARMRCTIRSVRWSYKRDDEGNRVKFKDRWKPCITAQTMKAKNMTDDLPKTSERHTEDEEGYHERYEEQFMAQQAQIEELTQQIEEPPTQIVKVVQDPELKALLKAQEARIAKARAVKESFDE